MNQPTELAALPQSLVDAVKAELIRQRAMHFVDAEKALQAAGLPALLQALQDVARIASRGDVNIQPLLLPIREAADRALRQVLGADYKEGE